MTLNMSVIATDIDIHRWTRQEFDRLVELGAFDDKPIELINGYIIDMAPQSSLHTAVVHLVEEALRSACPADCCIRIQAPLALDNQSEPEPDIAIVSGQARDYLKQHPGSAFLVVEVAGSSLKKDQEIKKALYAGNNIPEYWIINLEANWLEVYRDPQNQTYRTRNQLRHGDIINPLLAPNQAIAVAEMLP